MQWHQTKTAREIANEIATMRPEPLDVANLKEIRRRIRLQREAQEDQRIVAGDYLPKGVFVGESVGNVRIRGFDLAAKSEAVQNARERFKHESSTIITGSKKK